jgi:hypothetical protein
LGRKSVVGTPYVPTALPVAESNTGLLNSFKIDPAALLQVPHGGLLWDFRPQTNLPISD